MSNRKFNQSLLAAAVLAAVLPAQAKWDGVHTRAEQPSFNEVAAIAKIEGRFAAADGRALTLFYPAFRSKIGDAKAMAREFVEARAAQLGIANSAASLKVSYERDDGAFSVIRFQQELNGVPVYGSDIAVTVRPNGDVIFVSSEARPAIAPLPVNTARSANSVRATVINAFKMPNARDEVAPQLMVYADAGPTRLVWIYVLRDSKERGAWEVIADADSGEILDARDTELRVEGTATIFDPNPLSTARATYGTGGYTDANDADSADLTSQLITVPLRDITQNGGVFSLQGPWARCEDWDSPQDATNDCPTSATGDFSASRASQRFEGPNVYFILDKQMRYLNQTLGVNVVPNNVAGGVRFDPHGFGGADNSSFTSSTDRLTFGEGAVDDAEDADVIIHELGHGLHDWITNGGLSQVQGLSEGVGDYFANSYNRADGNWGPTDPQWFWTFQWDGHNAFWGGRVTNYHIGRTYPNIGTGLHTPGQYWASCSMVAWVNIGRDAMDRAMLRGLAMTTSSSNQQVAAQAVITAAAAMGYTSAQINGIASAYNTSCNYGVTVPQLDVIFKDGFDPAS